MELSIPVWAQQITIFGVMIASVILGVWKYFKTETDKIKEKTPTETNSVVTAASFIDTKLVRELIDAIREAQEEEGRTSQRITRSQSELRETMIELIEILHLNSNSVMNLLRFMNRQNQIDQ